MREHSTSGAVVQKGFFIFSLALAFYSSTSLAQGYYVRQYRVENGLSSDIIKGSIQDESSYFWIATDDGLLRYDGVKFTPYREALRSNYAKGFLKTKSGRLLAYGDLDLIEIIERGDTVAFKSIRLGTRNPNDSTLWYPKSLFEDRRRNLWVGEPQSVVRLNGNRFTRFDFGIEDRSPQFVRSFLFFEDRAGQLFTLSINGNLFRFSDQLNAFQKTNVTVPGPVESILVLGNDLIIGTGVGLFVAPLAPDGGVGLPELALKIGTISCITPIDDQKLFIATRGKTHFIWNRVTRKIEKLPFSIKNINHVYISSEHDIWMSSDEGLVLAKENLIQNASPNLSEFVECVAEDERNHKVYFATMTELYAVEKPTAAAPVRIDSLLSTPSGYFQSLAFAAGSVFAANGFSLLVYNHNKIQKETDFAREGRFITDIVKDSRGNLWLAQAGNNQALVLDGAQHLRRIKVPLDKEGTINVIREGPDGMYAASTGKKAYLYFKSPGDDAFRNISVPVKFATHGDFNVTDLAFVGHALYLATSEGLLKFDHHTVTPVDLGATFTQMPVKTVKRYQQNNLLLTNAYGLILFDPASGDYHLFNESNGLASNTIPTRGLFIAGDESVWIGTSKGLCYTTKPLSNLEKTKLPQFVEILVNGKKAILSANQPIAFGTFIALTVSSITFPEKEVSLQYRLDPATPWQNVTGSVIALSDLPAGLHTVEVRAKKNGPYAWSDANFLKFEVAKPFWQKAWFYMIWITTGIFLIAVSIIWVNFLNKRRRKHLEWLIDERTNALKLSNEELSLRNNELDRFVYSASHDLSAPLKSILGLIEVAKMEDPSPQTATYLDLMKRSILKLDSFIRDIISYSRNARLPVKHEVVALRSLLESVWENHQFTPSVNKIRFELTMNIHSDFKSDETRLKIVFNNLISNAIKFHLVDRREAPFIHVDIQERQGYFEFTVSDNGMGIDPRMKEKIFDMFFRGTDSVQGSGLGLYILKETLNKLNGTVTVRSTIGEGTTFTIRIPT